MRVLDRYAFVLGQGVPKELVEKLGLALKVLQGDNNGAWLLPLNDIYKLRHGSFYFQSHLDRNSSHRVNLPNDHLQGKLTLTQN
jgi:hypothetical protein